LILSLTNSRSSGGGVSSDTYSHARAVQRSCPRSFLHLFVVDRLFLLYINYYEPTGSLRFRRRARARPGQLRAAPSPAPSFLLREGTLRARDIAFVSGTVSPTRSRRRHRLGEHPPRKAGNDLPQQPWSPLLGGEAAIFGRRTLQNNTAFCGGRRCRTTTTASTPRRRFLFFFFFFRDHIIRSQRLPFLFLLQKNCTRCSIHFNWFFCSIAQVQLPRHPVDAAQNDRSWQNQNEPPEERRRRTSQ